MAPSVGTLASGSPSITARRDSGRDNNIFSPPLEPDPTSSPSSHVPSLISDADFSDISSLDEDEYEIVLGDQANQSLSTSWVARSFDSSQMSRQHGASGENSAEEDSEDEDQLPPNSVNRLRASYETQQSSVVIEPGQDATITLPTQQGLEMNHSAGDKSRGPAGRQIVPSPSLRASTSADYLFPDPNLSAGHGPSTPPPDTDHRGKILAWLSQPDQGTLNAHLQPPSTPSSKPNLDTSISSSATSTHSQTQPKKTSQLWNGRISRYVMVQWLLAFLLGALWTSDTSVLRNRLGESFTWASTQKLRMRDSISGPIDTAQVTSVQQYHRCCGALETTATAPSSSAANSPRASHAFELAVIPNRTTDVALYRYFDLLPTSKPWRRSAACTEVRHEGADLQHWIRRSSQGAQKAYGKYGSFRLETFQGQSVNDRWLDMIYRPASQAALQIFRQIRSEYQDLDVQLRSFWTKYAVPAASAVQDAIRNEWKYWEAKLYDFWIHILFPILEQFRDLSQDAIAHHSELLCTVRRYAFHGTEALRQHSLRNARHVQTWYQAHVRSSRARDVTDFTAVRTQQFLQHAYRVTAPHAENALKAGKLLASDARRGAEILSRKAANGKTWNNLKSYIPTHPDPERVQAKSATNPVTRLRSRVKATRTEVAARSKRRQQERQKSFARPHKRAKSQRRMAGRS